MNSRGYNRESTPQHPLVPRKHRRSISLDQEYSSIHRRRLPNGRQRAGHTRHHSLEKRALKTLAARYATRQPSASPQPSQIGRRATLQRRARSRTRPSRASVAAALDYNPVVPSARHTRPHNPRWTPLVPSQLRRGLEQTRAAKRHKRGQPHPKSHRRVRSFDAAASRHPPFREPFLGHRGISRSNSREEIGSRSRSLSWTPAGLGDKKPDILGSLLDNKHDPDRKPFKQGGQTSTRYKLGSTIGVYDRKDGGWHLGAVIAVKFDMRLVPWKQYGSKWFNVKSESLRNARPL